MFPLFFPGVFTFIKSYIKMGLFFIMVTFLTGFVSYHYVVITRYEKKFDSMNMELRSLRADKENTTKQGYFSQGSIDEIVNYYERELSKCKSHLKKDGELQDNEILHNNKNKIGDKNANIH
jgi:hypothetical protein